MGKKDTNLEETVFGISPLGGNSVEGAGSSGVNAEVRDDSIQGVPLVWDSRVSAYISEQAKEELDDKDISEQKQRAFQEEQDFIQRAGYGNNQ